MEYRNRLGREVSICKAAQNSGEEVSDQKEAQKICILTSEGASKIAVGIRADIYKSHLEAPVYEFSKPSAQGTMKHKISMTRISRGLGAAYDVCSHRSTRVSH